MILGPIFMVCALKPSLFILAVYLPSSNHALEEFKECLNHLWAFYDSLSADGFVILLGDFNGDLGNSFGDKGKKEPNDRGFLLLDFADFFQHLPCKPSETV